MKNIIFTGLILLTFSALTIVCLQYIPSLIGLNFYECTGQCDWFGHEFSFFYCMVVAISTSIIASGLITLVVYYLIKKLQLQSIFFALLPAEKIKTNE